MCIIKHACQTCSKSFSTSSNCCRHEKYYCKVVALEKGTLSAIDTAEKAKASLAKLKISYDEAKTALDKVKQIESELEFTVKNRKRRVQEARNGDPLLRLHVCISDLHAAEKRLEKFRRIELRNARVDFAEQEEIYLPEKADTINKMNIARQTASAFMASNKSCNDPLVLKYAKEAEQNKLEQRPVYHMHKCPDCYKQFTSSCKLKHHLTNGDCQKVRTRHECPRCHHEFKTRSAKCHHAKFCKTISEEDIAKINTPVQLNNFENDAYNVMVDSNKFVQEVMYSCDAGNTEELMLMRFLKFMMRYHPQTRNVALPSARSNHGYAYNHRKNKWIKMKASTLVSKLARYLMISIFEIFSFQDRNYGPRARRIQCKFSCLYAMLLDDVDSQEVKATERDHIIFPDPIKYAFFVKQCCVKHTSTESSRNAVMKRIHEAIRHGLSDTTYEYFNQAERSDRLPLPVFVSLAPNDD